MKKQTAFRLEDSLIQKLKELAKKDNRSLNNYIEKILIDHIKISNFKNKKEQ